MAKRKVFKTNPIRKYIIIALFVFFIFGVGYSVLSSNLSISGNLAVDKYDHTLYGVLEKAQKKGLAVEYTGEHLDSITEQPSKKIYHWYAEPNTPNSKVDEMINSCNVIFAGFCWQLYRTTDTGGVKLIYNGIPNQQTCNNTGTAQQIGTSVFNSNDNSVADVGFMYNKRYETQKISIYTSEEVYIKKIMDLSSNYYVASEITYDSTSNEYSLVNATQDTWRNLYSSSTGLYICLSNTETCSKMYYIVISESDCIYGFELIDGHLMNYYNTDIILGLDYTENNGTYTLNNTTTISKTEWALNYNNYEDYYICDNNTTSCQILKRIISETKYRYYVISSDRQDHYSDSFTYNSSTNIYTLSGNIIDIWDSKDNDNNIYSHRYTCFDNSNKCQKLKYITRKTSGERSYIELENGISIENAIDEMLYSDNVNTYDSAIKTYIDNWYANNLTGYTSYLEDTTFCYNRVQENADTNYYNNNTTTTNNYVSFKKSSLKCENITDRFSMANSKAKLTYPVGLLSYGEANLLGYNRSNNGLLRTGSEYYMGSPFVYYLYYAVGSVIKSNGNPFSHSEYSDYYYRVTQTQGVRPVISIKPGTEYSSGDGSKDNPYIIDTN